MANDYLQRLSLKVPSALVKVFGIFKIAIGSSSPIFLVIMENLSKDLDNPLVFDLKGSTHQRNSTFTQYSSFINMPRGRVYKDLDYFALEKPFNFSKAITEKILETLQLDSDLLENYEIMDYSLLLMIENVEKRHHKLLQYRNYFQYEKYILRIGIIDYLQCYSSRKKVENTFNTLRLDDISSYSCIPPCSYKTRFLEMARKIF